MRRLFSRDAVFTGAVRITALLALPFFGLMAQNTCHAADRNSDLFVKQFQALMGTDQDAVQLRARFNLSLVPISQIVLVSDPTVCARTGAAADSMMTVWDSTDPAVPTTAPIYVIKIGTSYAMADLNAPPAYQEERTSIWIFGPLWEYRGMLSL
jgi:hypothetical protein